MLARSKEDFSLIYYAKTEVNIVINLKVDVKSIIVNKEFTAY